MKTQRKTSLWFGKYNHSVKFLLPEAFVLRKLDHDNIDHIIHKRKEWGRKLSVTVPQPGSWLYWQRLDITDNQISNLHKFCDFLINDNRPRKIKFFGDWVYLYTTDKSLIDDVCDLDYIDKKTIMLSQIEQVGTPGTVLLKNAKKTYRSYFYNRPIDSKQRESLERFLSNQEDLRMGPALMSALARGSTKKLFDYYFIDHNDFGMITMINLIVPGCIRKTMPIKADK